MPSNLCLVEVENKHQSAGFLGNLDLNFFPKIYLYEYFHIFTCTPFTHEGQEREVESLELQLQMVLSPYMGSGTPKLVLWKSSKCS